MGLVRLLTDADWAPREHLYRLTAMLASSLLLTFGALFLAAPLGIAYAVVCAFYANRRTAACLLWLVEVSAGMPTVVYGLWGLVVVVPWLGAFFSGPGTSLLAGVLILSMMIFPTITVVSHAAIQAVPRSYLYASTALGVSRASTIRHVVFHHARAGFFSAATLAAARAIGETIVVLMVCGNVVQIPDSLLDPVRALTANIALEMPYATGMHQSALYATGLMVLCVVTVLVVLSESYAYRQARSRT
ncbi:Phosphate transport system permease protein PstC [compost metagenome]